MVQRHAKAMSKKSWGKVNLVHVLDG